MGALHCGPIPMTSRSDADCLTTTAGVLIDGANAVCSPRSTSPIPLSASAPIELSIFVVGLWALSRNRWKFALLLGALAVLPGLSLLAFVRADAPGRSRPAAELGQLLATLEHTSNDGRCLEVVRNQCVACTPVVAYAQARRAGCRGRRTVELGASAIGGACGFEGGALVCGVRTTGTIR